MAAQPQFTELFAMGATRRANGVYQATTAWLVLLTWPLYLLVIVYGPEFLSIFGRSYQAGYSVLVILGPHHAPVRRVRAGGHGPDHHRTQQLEPDERAAGGGGEREAWTCC